MSGTAYDIVIRGGAIVDGSGAPPVAGDVAIIGDTIAAIGTIAARGREEIDAAGLLVTPGFVDIHTHYDGQSIWESRLNPSSGHGVTTVVMGNCGVGFAPCRPEDRERLIELMEGVEDIPGVVMAEGLSWDWESYPQFLDAVDARPHDINIASYLPHAALRVFVMGKRASVGEAATPADIAQMAELTRDAMQAGAIGFSTSRSLFHKSSSGESIPTLEADSAELGAIASAMQDAGSGILQIASDYKNFTDVDNEFALIRDVAERTGREMTLPIAQTHGDPESWRKILSLIEDANRDGITVTAQALPRGIGLLLGLDLSMHPFSFCPSYMAIHHLPLAERIERMRDPALKARIIAETPVKPTLPLQQQVRRFAGMFEITEPLDYEPSLDRSLAARAERDGVVPEALAYDMLLGRGAGAALFLPFANYAHGNLDAALEIIRHDHVVLGLGDGGAHYGVICDASYPTFLLAYWTRDRTRGERLALPDVVKALTSETARAVGLRDRGLIAPGYRADINLIDHARLTLGAPEVAFDLPAGGRRLTQRASGYVATIVNGIVVYREGEPTGALPGRLIRGPQPAPVHA
ncbi:N-acyl-D-amino-acid deacylase family protein [Flavisphingomonas formosensis]|uniref:N-acyl-D-amino-acid deacylase family protein n=1 Tax=Flavisphingomonas formosensis TaxID=861534 RepID=UPI0012FB4F71|nr:amidohydrolase family protein [Sphingomonas formosensis]